MKRRNFLAGLSASVLARAGSVEPELVLWNANIHTMDAANPHCEAALLKLDTFAEMHAVAPYSKGWAMRGANFLATGDAAPAVTYCAGWLISTASWARGIRPGDIGRRLWHAGSNGRWNCGVVIAPEIDFAVLVACNRGIAAAWKTRQTVMALIRTFAPKRTS